MYVLRYVATVATAGIPAGEEGFFPADRCVFATRPSTTGNYNVVDDNILDFYPGNAAAIDLNVATNLVELGYIGKTGRFVATTSQRTL